MAFPLLNVRLHRVNLHNSIHLKKHLCCFGAVMIHVLAAQLGFDTVVPDN